LREGEIAGPKEVIVVQIYREVEQARVRDFIVSGIGGDQPARRRKAIRPFLLFIVFLLMSLPVMFDLLFK
jgi:hypothetical protein